MKTLEDALDMQPNPERWSDIARWLSTPDREVDVEEAKVSVVACAATVVHAVDLPATSPHCIDAVL